MKALEFPKGNYYAIYCKSGQQALRIQQNDPGKFDGSRILSAPFNAQDNGHVFMIQKVGQKDDDFEIINCLSTFVFGQSSNQIRLQPGKQSGSQLFFIKEAKKIQNRVYYWIHTTTKGDKSLKLEGILRCVKSDPNDEAQLFRFQLINNNSIQTSALIVNNYTGKALDVPRATRKAGQRIIQWQKNKRWNQRWQFQRQGNGVIIKSLLNGLVLDIQKQSKKSGAEVIQWTGTGKSNQLWIPQPCGQGIYRFRSAHQHTLLLAIKKQNVNNGGQLQVCKDDNPTCQWRVQGAQP